VAPPPDIAAASVYFDYDSSDLTPATRDVLQAFFQQAQKQPIGTSASRETATSAARASTTWRSGSAALTRRSSIW